MGKISPRTRASEAQDGAVTAAGRVALHRPLAGIGLRVLATACLALMFALVKWCGSRGVPVLEVIFFRNAFAFVPLALYIWRTAGPGALRTQRPLGHLARSAVGLGGMLCSFSAVKYLPLTEAMALQFASPLFMTALSVLLLRERVGRHRWSAVALGFVGVMIMARPIPGQMNLPGVTLALLSALGVAGAMVAIRQISDTERGSTIVFYFTLAGTVLGLAGCFMFGWVTPDLWTLGLLILSGMVGGVAQILLTEALRLAPVGMLAPFDYAQLVWAALLGAAIWGEVPRLTTLVGGSVVVASGLYILQREISRRRLHP